VPQRVALWHGTAADWLRCERTSARPAAAALPRPVAARPEASDDSSLLARWAGRTSWQPRWCC
jgi:hypothetical protein